MPKYDAQCGKCLQIHEYVSTVAKCLDTPECCGQKTHKVILNAPRGYVLGKFDAFKSPVDGSIITGRRALEEHNRRNGVVSLADGYSDDKIRSGDFGKPSQAPKLDKKELVNDVAQAISMVRDGYKPTLEVLNDD